jgi:hypothetical protein
MRRNISSQTVCGQLVSKTDGSAVTSGTTTVYVLKDGGTQTTGSGTVTHEGNGCWSYIATQSDSDALHVAFTFANSTAVSATVNVYPLAKDASSVASSNLTHIGGTAIAFAAGDLTTAKLATIPTTGTIATAGDVSGLYTLTQGATNQTAILAAISTLGGSGIY